MRTHRRGNSLTVSRVCPGPRTSLNRERPLRNDTVATTAHTAATMSALCAMSPPACAADSPTALVCKTFI
jgi:hypothetical protein